MSLVTILVFSGCGAPTSSTARQDRVLAPGENAQGNAQTSSMNGVEMPHIHGLGFSADGSRLLVPAHDGLRIYTDGAWQIPDVPAHDYMGYAPTDDGFYSSGHPGPSARLPNPLGLVKSSDGGRTLTTLGFAGESDFHLMGVGYENHAIYVVNPAPNSRLPTGLHYSLDDGKTWKQSAAKDIPGQPIQLAVHPTQANVVALATEAGVTVSSDHGDSFERIPTPDPPTAVAFSSDGGKLYVGGAKLAVYDMASKQVTQVETALLGAQDAISYIAVNPVQPKEIAIATFGRSIFRTTDGGMSWEQIAENGRGK